MTAPCRHRHTLHVAGVLRYVCCPEKWWTVALPAGRRLRAVP